MTWLEKLKRLETLSKEVMSLTNALAERAIIIKNKEAAITEEDFYDLYDLGRVSIEFSTSSNFLCVVDEYDDTVLQFPLDMFCSDELIEERLELLRKQEAEQKAKTLRIQQAKAARILEDEKQTYLRLKAKFEADIQKFWENS